MVNRNQEFNGRIVKIALRIAYLFVLFVGLFVCSFIIFPLLFVCLPSNMFVYLLVGLDYVLYICSFLLSFSCLDNRSLVSSLVFLYGFKLLNIFRS